MTSPSKKITTALLALVAVAAALCLLPQQSAAQTPAPQEAKWERYAFPGDEFSVELPAMPFVFHTSRSITTKDWEKTRVFGLYADRVIFMVVAFDKPRPSETPDHLVAQFPGGAHGAAPEDVSAGGLEGKEYRGASGVSRVFFTKKRAYLVKALSREGRDASVNRFIDSLTLSAKPPGRGIDETVVTPPAPYLPRPGAPGAVRGENTQTDTGARPAPAPTPQLADDDPRRVFYMKELTQKAVIVYKGDPGFSEEARQNNVTGVVRLRVVLNSAGRVTNVSVIKGLPAGLTDRAVHTARHILFFPAQKDGRDVAQYVTLEYNFNIY